MPTRDSIRTMGPRGPMQEQGFSSGLVFTAFEQREMSALEDICLWSVIKNVKDPSSCACLWNYLGQKRKISDGQQDVDFQRERGLEEEGEDKGG